MGVGSSGAGTIVIGIQTPVCTDEQHVFLPSIALLHSLPFYYLKPGLALFLELTKCR